ncbi:MAG TPA: peptide deformylase, partial [Candidatus Limnocylindrales bacterium]|nr:peptide deformylase [Candidatus Limnocylindrales bacterium]
MPLQPIRLFGDPVLRTPAAPVETFDKELRTLVADLTDTMMDAPGVGLAAPQIGVSLRVFTYWVDDVVGHLINPSLDLSEEEQDGEEGCLSLPGLTYDTKRAMRVVAKGMDMHGEPVIIEGSELLARCVQHETDHL